MDMLLAHWSANWLVIVAYLSVAAMHAAGLRHLLAAPPGGPGAPPASRRELLREAAAFHAGLLCALAALISPVAYWSGTYIWVRGIQDLMLAFVAPPLIVLGAPWLALRAGWQWPNPGAAGQPASASAAPGTTKQGSNAASTDPARGLRRLPWAAGVVIAFNVTWLGWHLPLLFDLAVRNGGVRAAEYVSYLGIGIAFWVQLIGSRPLRPRCGALRRVAFIFATTGAGTVLGMVLVFGSGVLYPAYDGAAHHVMTVLDDQQLAGAILWMGMLPPLIIAAVALLMRWLDDEESEALTAGLDRLLVRRQSAWPARPGPGLR
jgi:cytochrome c oxidase assembly factor CtaG